MKSSFPTLYLICLGFVSGAQADERPLRDILIHGPSGSDETVVWLHQPGGGLDLGGAIDLPCLLSDLSFLPSGDVALIAASDAGADCPADILSGERQLKWETVIIERLGVERLRITDPQRESLCDFAVIGTAPALDLATTCDDQDHPRYFRFVPELGEGAND